MDLAEIDDGLKSHEFGYSSRIFKWQDMAITRLADQIRLDSISGTPENAVERAALGRSIMELSNDLFNRRTRIANFGRGQLNKELKKQERN